MACFLAAYGSLVNDNYTFHSAATIILFSSERMVINAGFAFFLAVDCLECILACFNCRRQE